MSIFTLQILLKLFSVLTAIYFFFSVLFYLLIIGLMSLSLVLNSKSLIRYEFLMWLQIELDN